MSVSHARMTMTDSFFSDEDEDEEHEHQGAVEPDVAEGEEDTKPKIKTSTPHELHMYSEAELAKFRREELIADAELLDGSCLYMTGGF